MPSTKRKIDEIETTDFDNKKKQKVTERKDEESTFIESPKERKKRKPRQKKEQNVSQSV